MIAPKLMFMVVILPGMVIICVPAIAVAASRADLKVVCAPASSPPEALAGAVACVSPLDVTVKFCADPVTAMAENSKASKK